MNFLSHTRSAGLAVMLAVGVTACDQASGPDELSVEATRLSAKTLSQTDHFGLPAINTVFIPSGQKQRYNRTAPSTDPAFVAEVRGYIEGFLQTMVDLGLSQGAPFPPSALASVLYPDIQPLDFPDAILATGGALSGFPDGRDIDDDVIDTELFLIFGNNPNLNSDYVDSNDKPRLPVFPYLPDPHTN